MIKEYFRIILVSLRHRKLRSWLAITGILIGVTAIVALVSLGQGMTYAFDRVFEGVGADKIIITPGGGFSTPMTASMVAAKLEERDLRIISSERGVEHALGVIGEMGEVTHRKSSRSLMVFGMPVDSKTGEMIQKIDLFKVITGRQLREGDRYNAVIGARVAEDLFDSELRINNKIFVEGVEFTIVGIQERSGSPIHDRIVRIPQRTAVEIFDTEIFSTIFVQVADGHDVNNVAESIKQSLRRVRDVREGQEDFSVTTSEQVLSGVYSILGWVQIVFISIAGISLVVGGLGIMNTMYTSVLERTKEIGILKAVGARNLDILSIFVIEAGILGLVGGTIGATLGIAVAKIVELTAGRAEMGILRVFISPGMIVMVLAFSVFIGMVFGLLPAIKASRLSPMEAIRHG